MLDRSVDGVAFPDWEARFGWQAVGVRRDEIADREAVTVSYKGGARRITYTIVAGTDHINSARPVVTRYRDSPLGKIEISFVAGAASILTKQSSGPIVIAFKRGRRTVVMATRDGDSALARTMMRLANWRAGGRLRY